MPGPGSAGGSPGGLSRYAETGQIAYEAYTGYKAYLASLGQRASSAVPRWGELSEQERDAWRVTAREVFRKGWQEK